MTFGIKIQYLKDGIPYIQTREGNTKQDAILNH